MFHRMPVPDVRWWGPMLLIAGWESTGTDFERSKWFDLGFSTPDVDICGMWYNCITYNAKAGGWLRKHPASGQRSGRGRAAGLGGLP